MRETRTALLAITLSALTSATTLAQSYTIAVGSDGAVTSATLVQSGPNPVTANQATVAVECAAGADCAGIDMSLVDNDGNTLLDLGSDPAASATSSNFAIPRSAVGGQGAVLQVDLGGGEKVNFPVVAVTPAVAENGAGGDGTTTDNGGDGNARGPSLAQLLATQCDDPAVGVAPYDEANNRAEIIVSPLGQVIASGFRRATKRGGASESLFDENDTLVVRVLAAPRLLGLLNVKRTSAFRDVNAVHIVGEGTTVQGLRRQSVVVQCRERRFELDNFAPGQATVQVSVLQGTEPEPTGSFDFNVNTLYTGMLTLGAAQTQLVDPDFKLATVDGETVIAATEEGDDDLVYTLFYTPYVWGKRDLFKGIPRNNWYKRLNPSIGVAPEDVAENAFVGITAELPAGFTLTFGRHFGKVGILTGDTEVGSPFDGEADAIPTATKWKNDNFWAISIDLRAMAKVLSAALGSGGG